MSKLSKLRLLENRDLSRPKAIKNATSHFTLASPLFERPATRHAARAALPTVVTPESPAMSLAFRVRSEGLHEERMG
jgi:hypothetical protein